MKCWNRSDGLQSRRDARRVSEHGYFPQSLRQAQIIILEILQCIPVVIIFAFLDLGKNISFSDTLLGGPYPFFLRIKEATLLFNRL